MDNPLCECEIMTGECLHSNSALEPLAAWIMDAGDTSKEMECLNVTRE
jgi:hypothetical protein